INRQYGEDNVLSDHFTPMQYLHPYMNGYLSEQLRQRLLEYSFVRKSVGEFMYCCHPILLPVGTRTSIKSDALDAVPGNQSRLRRLHAICAKLCLKPLSCPNSP